MTDAKETAQNAELHWQSFRDNPFSVTSWAGAEELVKGVNHSPVYTGAVTYIRWQEARATVQRLDTARENNLRLLKEAEEVCRTLREKISDLDKTIEAETGKLAPHVSAANAAAHQVASYASKNRNRTFTASWAIARICDMAEMFVEVGDVTLAEDVMESDGDPCILVRAAVDDQDDTSTGTPPSAGDSVTATEPTPSADDDDQASDQAVPATLPPPQPAHQPDSLDASVPAEADCALGALESSLDGTDELADISIPSPLEMIPPSLENVLDVPETPDSGRAEDVAVKESAPGPDASAGSETGNEGSDNGNAIEGTDADPAADASAAESPAPEEPATPDMASGTVEGSENATSSQPEPVEVEQGEQSEPAATALDAQPSTDFPSLSNQITEDAADDGNPRDADGHNASPATHDRTLDHIATMALIGLTPPSAQPEDELVEVEIHSAAEVSEGAKAEGPEQGVTPEAEPEAVDPLAHLRTDTAEDLEAEEKALEPYLGPADEDESGNDPDADGEPENPLGSDSWLKNPWDDAATPEAPFATPEPADGAAEKTAEDGQSQSGQSQSGQSQSAAPSDGDGDSGEDGEDEEEIDDETASRSIRELQEKSRRIVSASKTPAVSTPTPQPLAAPTAGRRPPPRPIMPLAVPSTPKVTPQPPEATGDTPQAEPDEKGTAEVGKLLEKDQASQAKTPLTPPSSLTPPAGLSSPSAGRPPLTTRMPPRSVLRPPSPRGS